MSAISNLRVHDSHVYDLYDLLVIACCMLLRVGNHGAIVIFACWTHCLHGTTYHFKSVTFFKMTHVHTSLKTSLIWLNM